MYIYIYLSVSICPSTWRFQDPSAALAALEDLGEAGEADEVRTMPGEWRKISISVTHMLHVGYIYLQNWVIFSGKCW